MFTYYLKDGLKSQKAARREREIEVEKAVAIRRTRHGMRCAPRTVSRTGHVHRDSGRGGECSYARSVRMPAKGLHRSAWDLRLPPPDPINLLRQAAALLDA